MGKLICFVTYPNLPGLFVLRSLSIYFNRFLGEDKEMNEKPFIESNQKISNEEFERKNKLNKGQENDAENTSKKLGTYELMPKDLTERNKTINDIYDQDLTSLIPDSDEKNGNKLPEKWPGTIDNNTSQIYIPLNITDDYKSPKNLVTKGKSFFLNLIF